MGALEIAADGARLSGSNGRTVRIHHLPRGEITAVIRAGQGERLAGYRSLRLELRGGQVLHIASVIGMGVLTELLDGLTALVTSL